MENESIRSNQCLNYVDVFSLAIRFQIFLLFCRLFSGRRQNVSLPIVRGVGVKEQGVLQTPHLLEHRDHHGVDGKRLLRHRRAHHSQRLQGNQVFVTRPKTNKNS